MGLERCDAASACRCGQARVRGTRVAQWVPMTGRGHRHCCVVIRSPSAHVWMNEDFHSCRLLGPWKRAGREYEHCWNWDVGGGSGGDWWNCGSARDLDGKLHSLIG